MFSSSTVVGENEKEYVQGHEDGYRLGVKHGREQILAELNRLSEDITKLLGNKIKEFQDSENK